MVIKNRNLFRITRFILLKLPALFRFFAKFRATQQRLLIIKTDAIGDYILFRNYLQVVRTSEKFKNYSITLLGNELWHELALQYDHQFADDFLFISPGSLYQAPLKTLKLGWRLFKNNYQIVLQPSYTRHFITDGLAALTAAKQIIGFGSDNEAIAARYKVKTDKFYTRKLTLPQGVQFEFNRSDFFFEHVLNSSIPINSPTIPVTHTGKKGIVILPGAGVLKRSWEKEKFLELIKLIIKHTRQPVYIAGASHELQTGTYLSQNLLPGSVNNLIGKTSLPQLVQLIGNAALVIANETSAIHIAAATQTSALCILGGGHFERFAPYSAPVQNKPVCVYEKTECYNCNWNCKFETGENQPFPCISAISVQNVWLAVQQLLLTV